MSSIQSVTQSSHNALSGLNRALARLDDVASVVAAGIGSSSSAMDGSFAEQFASLAQLPEISLHARANAQVLNTVRDLNAEFLTRPRR